MHGFVEYNPPKPALNALDHHSFAYATLKDRLPVIITKLVDSTHRCLNKNDVLNDGFDREENLKIIIAELSKLRYELQCNKAVVPVSDLKLPARTSEESLVDSYWNEQIKAFSNYQVKWFELPWLFVECYLYRRFAQSFCPRFGTQYDWFSEHKAQSFHQSIHDIVEGGKKFFSLMNNLGILSDHDTFKEMIWGSLWGNQVDLSLHIGKHKAEYETHSDFASIASSNIISDHSSDLWDWLQQEQAKPGEIHIILDNTGTEHFSDLCLADWLITRNYCDKVIFHCKVYPWFVSDVTKNDFVWLLDEMMRVASSLDPGRVMESISKKWRLYLSEGKWEIKDNLFWNSFYPYTHMHQVAPRLFSEMSAAGKLWIFKGDLNYRKLVYDCKWSFSEDFNVALGSLARKDTSTKKPAILALRTCKADVVVGVDKDKIKKLDSILPNDYDQGWLVCGKYGVIQFSI